MPVSLRISQRAVHSFGSLHRNTIYDRGHSDTRLTCHSYVGGTIRRYAIVVTPMNIKFRVVLLGLASILMLGMPANPPASAAPSTSSNPLAKAAQKLKYVLDLPADYDSDPHKVFPLLVYLHGAGESGTNLTWLNRHGPPKYVAKHPDAPFILLAPQAPRAIGWQPYLRDVQTLIDQIQATYRVNPRRIYLTGNSMGGNGTWELARRWPDRFAAIVPVASFINDHAKSFCVLKGAAIWVIHGKDDESIASEEAEQIVVALRKCGLTPKFTLLPQTKHVATNEVYADPQFYSWLLAQTRP